MTMEPDAPSPLQRSLYWSFPGFVAASILLLPLAMRWQQALFAKLSFANPLTTSTMMGVAMIGGPLLLFTTVFTSWKAIVVLEKGRNSIGENCLILWNTLVMLFAALASINGILAVVFVLFE